MRARRDGPRQRPGSSVPGDVHRRCPRGGETSVPSPPGAAASSRWRSRPL